MCIAGHHHFTSAAESEATMATPNSRFESKSPPRLYKWSRPSPFPPYYSYQYETIRDVVPPDPTVRHRTILHSVIGSTTTTTTTTSGLIATKLGVGIQTLDFE